MKPTYLLAVDGGGTKTDFCLSDVDGAILCQVRSGPGSHKSVPLQQARSNLAQGVEALRQQTGVLPGEIAMSVWGLSGCDSREDIALMTESLEGLGFSSDRFCLCNDAVPAFYACVEAPGLIAIAGTGSIVIGIGKDGSQRRAGGWGYGFSDLGSGQWLGCEALKQALLYCDGCVPYSPLFDAVARQLGAASLEQLPWAASNLRDAREVAALCPALFACPGDPVAQKILEEGGRYLADEIEACIRRWREPGPYTIVLAGGVLTRCEAYRRLVITALQQREAAAQCGIRVLEQSPCVGGLRMARRALGLEEPSFAAPDLAGIK